MMQGMSLQITEVTVPRSFFQSKNYISAKSTHQHMTTFSRNQELCVVRKRSDKQAVSQTNLEILFQYKECWLQFQMQIVKKFGQVI